MNFVRENSTLILAFVFLVIAVIGMVVVYYNGYHDGIAHAITESKFSVDGNDIQIDLDGELYIHKAE